MKSFWADFKKFISKGNIIDLAVAVIIGAAFGAIITSLVNDIIMPFVSFIVKSATSDNGDALANLKTIIVYANEAEGITEVAINWGNLIQVILNFLIIAFVIFVIFRIITRAQKQLDSAIVKIKRGKKGAPAPAPAEPKKPTTDELLTEIRDLLKAQMLPVPEVIAAEDEPGNDEAERKEKDNGVSV